MDNITDMSVLMELRELRQEMRELHEETKRPTKAEILAIKDRSKRLKAIEDNMDLFIDNLPVIKKEGETV